jgi:hypothetical protein
MGFWQNGLTKPNQNNDQADVQGDVSTVFHVTRVASDMKKKVCLRRRTLLQKLKSLKVKNNDQADVQGDVSTVFHVTRVPHEKKKFVCAKN